MKSAFHKSFKDDMEKRIDTMFESIAKDYSLKRGDISPDQIHLVDSFNEMLCEFVFQNR